MEFCFESSDLGISSKSFYQYLDKLVNKDDIIFKKKAFNIQDFMTNEY